jgi:hypothetical protein
VSFAGEFRSERLLASDSLFSRQPKLAKFVERAAWLSRDAEPAREEADDKQSEADRDDSKANRQPPLARVFGRITTGSHCARISVFGRCGPPQAESSLERFGRDVRSFSRGYSAGALR